MLHVTITDTDTREVLYDLITTAVNVVAIEDEFGAQAIGVGKASDAQMIMLANGMNLLIDDYRKRIPNMDAVLKIFDLMKTTKDLNCSSNQPEELSFADILRGFLREDKPENKPEDKPKEKSEDKPEEKP